MTKGFTLIEVLIGGAVAAVVALIAVSFLSSSVRTFQVSQASSDEDTSLVLAQKFIRRIGRVASGCARVMVLGNPSLQCQIDFTSPPTGVLTPVRFLLLGETLTYQIQTAPNVWTTRQTFPGMRDFTVCDSNQLTAGTCAILPASLNLAADTTNPRYFRYQLRGKESRRLATAVQGHAYMGAFTARNPSAFDATASYHFIYRRSGP